MERTEMTLPRSPGHVQPFGQSKNAVALASAFSPALRAAGAAGGQQSNCLIAVQRPAGRDVILPPSVVCKFGKKGQQLQALVGVQACET